MFSQYLNDAGDGHARGQAKRFAVPKPGNRQGSSATFNPQMSQMDTDEKCFICAHLRHLRIQDYGGVNSSSEVRLLAGLFRATISSVVLTTLSRL